jgi:hypothetical protein
MIPPLSFSSIFFLFIILITEVGKVTLKSNSDEALSDESLSKINGDEA